MAARPGRRQPRDRPAEGFDGLARAQRAYLDEFWSRADVEIDGDPALQQAVRFALFQTLQASARAEERAIPAKGLTGAGYDGHAFWDSESFVLPLLTYIAPDLARDALVWRHSTLGPARQRARQVGLAGAAFPWRTIRGEECSGYWPAGPAAFHVNADIADAVRRYVQATGDQEFERRYGVELLVETARLWRSLGHAGADGRFRIDGVTGPDEYSALVNNNVYTNLMAQRNLQAAAEAAGRHPQTAAELGVVDDELAAWRAAAASMYLPYDADLGVHPQDEDYRARALGLRCDPARRLPAAAALPVLRPVPQAGRQAGRPRARPVPARRAVHAPRRRRRDFDYYEGSPCATRRCRPARRRSSRPRSATSSWPTTTSPRRRFIDLRRPRAQHPRRAAHRLAGRRWLGVVAGLGGMRDDGGRITFAPRLPAGIERVAFRVAFGGNALRVEVTPGEARYSSRPDGEPLAFAHRGRTVRLPAGGSATEPIPASQPLPEPAQPPHRAPAPLGGDAG